jgi:hypothetical protein
MFIFATKKNTGTSLSFVEVIAQTPRATAQTNATTHAGSSKSHLLKCAFSVQIALVWLKLEVGLGFQGSPRLFCLDFSFSNYFCFQIGVWFNRWSGFCLFHAESPKKSLIYIILMTYSMNCCLSFDGLKHWSVHTAFLFLLFFAKKDVKI